MSKINRREFIKNSAAASTGLASAGLLPRRIYSEERPEFKRVVYRTLGSTGYKVSEIGFGAMNTRNAELIQAAIDNGINYIDTAHGYMNGVNEEIVGTVMKTERDNVFLTTKIGIWNSTDIIGMLETSLKRLQTDRVDLVLLHAVDQRSSILNDDLMKKFDDARKKGMARFIGISTHSNQADSLDAAVESKLWDAVLVGYNYFSDPSVSKSIKKAREAGLGIIGMKNILNPHTNPWTALGDIREDKSSKTTPQQALIKWVLENPYVDTTIPGMTSFEHLEDDLNIMGMKLTFDERRTLRKYGENLKGNYCSGVAGCTGCRNKCVKGVQVNDINRCLGYAYGYGDIELAHENYNKLPDSSRVDICADCDECSVECINGLNITENIKKARELFA